MSLLESLKRPFTHTLALVGYLVLLATGLPLAVLYRPTAVSAAESIRTITFIAPYGWLLRNLHYWAAMLLLLTITLQLLLVLFTGHSRPPHRRNWLWGLAVLLLSGLLAFSGSVLRWDVDTVGALTAVAALTQQLPLIGDGLRHLLIGGAEITDATVGRFYIGHILGLSAPLLLLLGWQTWRVRRDGGHWAKIEDQRMGSDDPPILRPLKKLTAEGGEDAESKNFQRKTPRSLRSPRLKRFFSGDSIFNLHSSRQELIQCDGVVALALLCLLLGLALWVDAPLAPAVDGLNLPALREWGG